jgi:hypothetical protein
MLMFYF